LDFEVLLRYHHHDLAHLERLLTKHRAAARAAIVKAIS
jgi:7-keto-8-aminopelargonate synthetase-like enzyme